MFEIRLNDRGYQTGDTVMMEQVNKLGVRIPSEILVFEITFVTHFQQKEGWCVFGIKPRK